MTRFRRNDEEQWARPGVGPQAAETYRKAILGARTSDGWEAIAKVYREIIETLAETAPDNVAAVMFNRGFGHTALTTNLDAIEANRLAQHDG